MNLPPLELSLPQPEPLLIVLSGPSGVGKDAIRERLKELGKPFHFAVTATTRPKRSFEVEGVHYYFVSEERFAELREQGELLEWAQVYGNFYGIPKAPLREALARGEDVILKIDVQGAAHVKALAPGVVSIFVAPSSHRELAERLRQRGTEWGEDMSLRLRTAGEELAQLANFDYVVVNREGELDGTVAQIEAIVLAEKRRVRPRRVRL